MEPEKEKNPAVKVEVDNDSDIEILEERIPVIDGSKGKRLKIGYVSSDFGNHLMLDIFELQNRDHVEIFCYRFEILRFLLFFR